MGPLLSRRVFLGGALAVAATTRIHARESTRAAADSGPFDVIIVGAGLAGLHAARLLEAQGLSVKVIEGRSRVGGRVYTLDDIEGYPEGGGNGIGMGYGRILDTARSLGVELVPVRQRTEASADKTLISLRGQTITAAQWPDSPLNPFPKDSREVLPWAYQWLVFARENPLKGPTDWLDPSHRVLDVSVYDFMRGLGESEATTDLACRVGLIYGTSSYDFSALHMLQILAWGASQARFGRDAYAVKGGNQRLPEAMAAALEREIDYGRTLAAARTTDDGVEICCLDNTRYRARFAVLTPSFAALRHARFDPPLVHAQAEALATLGYSTAVQVHFRPLKPYWEIDGLPTDLWTDDFAGRLAALRYGSDPDEVTSLVSFVYGAQGAWLDCLPERDAAALVLDSINRIRPSTRGALEPVRVLSWQQDRFAGGTFSAWKPGQITRLAARIGDPWGRLHFAGEHTARSQRGMEGAMESGERVALEILERS